jgi:hypothetical protein
VGAASWSHDEVRVACGNVSAVLLIEHLERLITTCVSNDGTQKKVVGPEGVWSGLRQCTNNPNNACVASENVRPVPPGTYKMNRDDRPEHAGRNFWRLEPVPKIPGWKCGLPFVGSRCGFEFHPGSVSLGRRRRCAQNRS